MAAGEKVIPEITVGNQTYKLMDETAREHLVEVKSTTPTSEDNRLWIKEMSASEEEANTYEVPTIDEFNDLKSAIITGEVDNIPLFLVRGEFVYPDTGEFSRNQDFSRTDYIDLTGMPFLKIYNSTATTLKLGSFYNSSKTFINGSSFILTQGEQVVQIPSGAKYVALSNTNSAMQEMKVWSVQRLQLEELNRRTQNDKINPIFVNNGNLIPEKFKSIISIRLNKDSNDIPSDKEIYLWFVEKTISRKTLYIKTGSSSDIDSAGTAICAKIIDYTAGDFVKKYTTTKFESNTEYRFDIVIDWGKVETGSSSVVNNVKLNKSLIVGDLDNASFKYVDELIEEIEESLGVSGFDYLKSQVLLPSQLFFRSDREIPIFKRSLFQKYRMASDVEVGLVCFVVNGNTGNLKRVIDIREPTNFGGGSGVKTTNHLGRFIISNVKGDTSIIYRDCNIFWKNVDTIQNRTLKVMALGDSLTQGGNWNVTPVTLLSSDLANLGITTQFIGSIVVNLTNPSTSQSVPVHFEGRGGWRYRTLTGRESKFAGSNVVIPESQTKSEWVVGVDGTIDECKANNAFLYPAREEDLSAYPDHCYHFVTGNTGYNKSYTEDSTLGDYVIFDPTRYFSLRNIEIPDVLTIAFGTNEWYLGGFNLDDALDACKFIIEAFRRASQTMKIIVIPSNTLPLGRESAWESEAFSLAAGVCKIVDDMRTGGDYSVYCCPLYANGGRAFTFSQITSTENMDDDNDTQVGVTSDNVHILYTDSGSNQSYLGATQYIDGLSACVLNVI